MIPVCLLGQCFRIWASFDSRIKITEQADAIEISYELFDLRRHIR